MLTESQLDARRYSIASDMMNSFSLDLFSHIDSRGNSIVSGWSAYKLTSLLFAGASAANGAELSEVLRWDPNQRDDPPFKRILDAREPSIFQDALGMWVQKGVHLRRGYLKRVIDTYGAEHHSADFRSAPEGSRDEINRWVARHTENKIQDALPRGSVNSQTNLIVASATYLAATWRIPFRLSETEFLPFHLQEGSNRSVPMMKTRATFMASEEDTFSIVSVPFADSRYSLQIYLPHPGVDLASVERTVAAEGVDRYHRELAPHVVILSLPRFSIEQTIDLDSAFRAMGVRKAFLPEPAHYESMYHAHDAPIPIPTSMFQKARIDVDEVGVVAAAASIRLLGTGGLGSNPPLLVFEASRPFMFTLSVATHRFRASTILFMGRVICPDS